MKKRFVTKLLLFVILSMCFINCSRSKSVNEIEVSELLLSVSKEQHINYCKLLNEATKGDVTSIKQLVLLRFYDASGYDHGSVIVDLIKIIGEDKFIKSLATINKEEKQIVKGYLVVGLEYRNNSDLHAKTLKDVFPKIYIFLN